MDMICFLTEIKYVAGLLQWVHIQEVKPCSTPISTTCILSKFDSSDFSDPQLYHNSTVGALHYLGFTRLDVACRVHCVSKSMHQPMENHWEVVERIHSKLWHSFQKYIRSDDRHSVGAYCICHGTNMISWSCKQQQTVARKWIKI